VPSIIDLGCRVADVHHRYHSVHNALFGAASFRLLIDALRGSRRRTYGEFSQVLKELQGELAGLEAQITDVAGERPAKAADRELHRVMLEYIEALHRAIVALEVILGGLQEDESRYRDVGADGRSDFTRDRVEYDLRLLELERLGTLLNRLFSHY